MAVMGLAGGCAAPTDVSDPAGPSIELQTVPQSALTFLRNANGAPSLAALQMSFYAVKGETREIELYYHAGSSAPDSTRLLRFRVEKRALLARPNGTPFADGDSILITVSVADSTNLIVDLQPSGLTFDSKHPARIWFWWTETDPDLNHDGVVTAADTTALQSLSVWSQETPAALWNTLNSKLDFTDHQAEAKVYGFTRYAVAY